MKYVLLALLLVTLSVSANTQNEINHLLAFVKNTQCTYERNGKSHTGVEAVEHIMKKYKYFQDDIVTTEDFIEYAATKSKMSGKHYLVHCPSEPTIKSSDWILTELAHYRAEQ